MEAEVIFGKTSNALEYMYAGASDHPEVNKYQDSEETSDPKRPEDMDVDTRFLREVIEYHGMPVVGDRNVGTTQKTSDYDMTMDLDVANIDKNDDNIWRTIYEAIDEG